MAVVQPFRAVRYDEERAGPLADLVAPPYDVIGPDERLDYLRRSPYNVVHLTLPDSEEDAARAWQEWLRGGVLTAETEPGFWALSQDYVGPDVVARTRTGVVASLRLEPYENRVVLPHEGTHAGPKEGRLRLLRATGVQLEPIFLLYDGEQPFAVPEREPDAVLEGTRLWRLAPDTIAERLADRQLLIADGHHRYETALAYRAERRTEESGWMLAVLVSTQDEGLTIFPTHRIVTGMREPSAAVRARDETEALAVLAETPEDVGAAAIYSGGGWLVARGSPGELDVDFVARHASNGVRYTIDVEEAVTAVAEGQADAAFIVRPPRVQAVVERARASAMMPPKTTFFYPKIPSGLVFHPL